MGIITEVEKNLRKKKTEKTEKFQFCCNIQTDVRSFLKSLRQVQWASTAKGQRLIRSAAGWRIYIRRGSGIWSPLLGIPVGECRCHTGRLGRRPRTEAAGGPGKVTIWLPRHAPVHLLAGRCSGRGLGSGWPSQRRPCTRVGPSRIRFHASPGSLWPGRLASRASLRAKRHFVWDEWMITGVV